MTSKTSSSNQTAAAKKSLASRRFGISTALVKEDFRRYWAIPVIAFIGYFLSGIFYILVNYQTITDNRGSYMAHFIETMLEGSYWAFIFNMLWVPVLSSVLLFRYLHKTGHVMSAHSQPFSRSTILNSHAVSCALFCILPILATALVLVIIAKPVYFPADSYLSTEAIVNIFSRVRIINWAWDTILVSMFVLAVCILGGFATGTSFHHAVAACGFNVVLPVSIFFMTTYSEVYLFGFTDSQLIENLVSYSSPAIRNAYDGFLTAGENAGYIIVTLALYALCHFMYSKRKLERATDGVVFKAFDVGITLVFGYLGMTLLGLAFDSIFDSSMVITTTGYVAGALLGMIICRMIILKSIKILNKGTFRILGSYLIVAVLFIGCFGLDITGFEKRIPENAYGVAVDVNSDILGISDYGTIGIGLYTEPESIEAVKALHQFIIDNKDIIENRNSDSSDIPDDSIWFMDEDYTQVYLTYYDGTDEDAVSTVKRQYSVPTYLLLNSSELETFIQLDEFREKAKSNVPEPENIVNMDIHGGAYTVSNGVGAGITDPDMLKGFIDAYLKDIDAIDMEHVCNSFNRYEIVHVDISYRDITDDRQLTEPSASELAEITGAYGAVTTEALTDYGYYSSADLDISPAHKNSIQWLIDNGYESFVQFDSDAFDFAVIHRTEGWFDGKDEYDEIPVSDENMTVVTDKAKIEKYYSESRAHEVYGAFSSISTTDDDLYCVVFYTQVEDDKGMLCEYQYSFAAVIEGRYL